jgi:hypothetical protein
MVPEKAVETNGKVFAGGAIDANSARVLARSFYLELKDGGFDHNQILAASGELLDMVTHDLRARAAAARGQG